MEDRSQVKIQFILGEYRTLIAEIKKSYSLGQTRQKILLTYLNSLEINEKI